jgi:ABC-type glutathione transport system ATPase component
VDEDLVPRALVVRVLARYLRLPAGWDDAERQEFIDEAAEQVALRVAELADDWADRTVTEWSPGSTCNCVILRLKPS